ncbi:hypothetical protein CBS101457_006155 [Exobasidium rhododendri]|nr:hypothetical protein CBS101457_006155 [Exobasidium rhododendri]
MSGTLNRARRSVASCSRHQPFSTSAISEHRSLPRPRAVRPASQKDTRVPSNVHELMTAYPKHPLLAFFNLSSLTIKEGPDAKEEKEVIVPVSLSRMNLAVDKNSRAWLAPELRTKSSLELHQLWYSCLMERNKIRTTMDEIQRTGASALAQMANYNGYVIERRVKKTMARTKFVLNERRLALLEARRRVAARIASGETKAEIIEDDSSHGSLYEDFKNI